MAKKQKTGGAKRRFEVMDTTLRDGEQTEGVAILGNEKVSIAHCLLETVRVDRIEVASARVSEGERETVKMICDWARKKRMLDRVEILVTRNFRDFADPRHGAFDAGVAVAVDDQARIGLQYQGRVEQLRDPLRHSGRPHVPRNMAPPIQFGNAEGPQFSRDPVAGVIADQQERRGGVGPNHGDRRRIVGL